MITNFSNTTYAPNIPLGLEHRKEHRDNRRIFVKVRAVNDSFSDKVDALIYDVSCSGVGLVTYRPFAVGTYITIDVGGDLAATAEVIDLDLAQEPFVRKDMVRIGVELKEKNSNWPL